MGFCDIPKKLWAIERVRLLTIAAGIMICFGVYGIMQEKVMRSCYGGVVEGKEKVCSGESFTYEFTFVLLLCATYTIVAKFLSIVNNKIPIIETPAEDKTPIGWYAAAAFCYISAMVCGNMALRTITYPTQVIAKSSKPIPVMLLGVLLARKRYTIQKYIFVFMIVIGVIMFIYKDKKEDDKTNSYIGLSLVGMSLLADGVLGAIEDRMRAATKPSALNFMFAINLFSAIILSVAAIASLEIVDFYEFALRHPEVLNRIALAAFVGSFGQIFIFMMISEFGPLPCSITTTTRKFFTVLISVFFLGNPLSNRQWLATGIVFFALFADALFGKKHFCGPKPEGNDHGHGPVPTQEPLDLEKCEKQIENGVDSVELEKLNNGDKTKA